MRILALETSEYVSSIALWHDGRVTGERFPSRMDLCEKLTGRIQALLGCRPGSLVMGRRTAQMGTGSEPTTGSEGIQQGGGRFGACPHSDRPPATGLDAIAVSQGPGSFTGLRVGMATAKALAHALVIPVIGVPTQEAIAAAAEVGEGERVLVLQHARRDHVYAGVWVKSDAGTTALTPPEVVPNSALPDLIDGLRFITGPATEALGDQWPAGVVIRQSHPQAATVAMLAAGRVDCPDPRAAFTLQPLYLLTSQAERMKDIDVTAMRAGKPAVPRRLRLRSASLDDLRDVVRIENLSFSSPWTEASLRDELSGKLSSIFLIAELDGRVAGYIGAWTFAGEAHICTLAVDPPYRRCGLGEIMMLTLLQEVRRRDVPYAILEYRASNAAAAELYRKMGFDFVHRRRGYYQDTNEDAIVAAIPDLEAPEQRARLGQAEAQWLKRYPYELSVEI